MWWGFCVCNWAENLIFSPYNSHVAVLHTNNIKAVIIWINHSTFVVYSYFAIIYKIIFLFVFFNSDFNPRILHRCQKTKGGISVGSVCERLVDDSNLWEKRQLFLSQSHWILYLGSSSLCDYIWRRLSNYFFNHDLFLCAQLAVLESRSCALFNFRFSHFISTLTTPTSTCFVPTMASAPNFMIHFNCSWFYLCIYVFTNKQALA